MRTRGSEGHGSPRLSRADRNAYKKGKPATLGNEAAKDSDIIVPEFEDARSEERKALSREAARLREARKV